MTECQWRLCKLLAHLCKPTGDHFHGGFKSTPSKDLLHETTFKLDLCAKILLCVGSLFQVENCEWKPFELFHDCWIIESIVHACQCDGPRYRLSISEASCGGWAFPIGCIKPF